ncbi:MAG: 4-amino-4-deoxy-L-arabinose transferase, partial [Bradyrhizobium canariense]
GWLLLSLGLSGATLIMRDNWMRGIGVAELMAELEADPEFCGLALYAIDYPFVPGRGQLAARKPIYSFYRDDPLAKGRLPAVVKTHQAGFNRIIGPASLAGELPADFSPRSCATMSDDKPACVFARRGACDAPASPFGVNDVLVRLNY